MDERAAVVHGADRGQQLDVGRLLADVAGRARQGRDPQVRRMVVHREQGRTLPHDLQAEMPIPHSELGARRRVEAGSIVLHPQLDRRLVADEPNAHAARAGMFRHVGQRLLQNAVHGGLQGRRQDLRIESLDPQVHGDPVPLREFLDVTGHGRGEPDLVEDARVEPPREASHLIEGLGGYRAEPLCQLGCLCDGPGLLDRAQPHEQRRERLPSLVVELTRDPPSFLFLRRHRLLDQPIAQLLRPLALADVRDHADHADDVRAPLELQRSDGDRHRHQRAAVRTQGRVGPPVLPVPGRDQGVERRLLGRRHELAQRRADYAPERHPHDVGEPPVAIGDRAVPRQGHGALVHLIEQDAVRQLRACEGDDVLPPRPRDHDGIHFTGPDGAERLLGRFQPVPQLPDSSQRPARGLAFLGHGGRRLLLVVTRQHIQPDQHAFHIREVTDDLADRRRQRTHQRRDHDDVVPARQVRFVEEVDDLDAVAAGEVAVAQALQVGEGSDGFRRLACHVQPQPPSSARSVLHFTPRRRRGFGSLPGARGCRASRAAPIATLPSPRPLTSSSTTPRSVITNSRTWFECAMPRALTIWIVRLRSPFASRFPSSIHTSINDDTPRSVRSAAAPPSVSEVKSAVICRSFMKSMSRASMAFTSVSVPTAIMFVTGSTTTTRGFQSSISRCIVTRCASRPRAVGRWACTRNRSRRAQGSRSMPTDRMFRAIWVGDSSKAKYRQRSPLWLAASAKCDATLDLPVPAVPDTSTLLPRKNPFFPNIASNPATPVDRCALDAWCASPSDVIGSTETPWSSMRNGISLPPCAEPRYLRMRNRRVALCSITRWSSRITQSGTSSPRPWRVRCSPSRSPVTTAVTRLVFSHRNSRANSARTSSLSDSPENSTSMVSRTTRFAWIVSIAWPSRMNNPSRSYSPLSVSLSRSSCT